MPANRPPRRQPPPRRAIGREGQDDVQNLEEAIVTENDVQGPPLPSEPAFPSERLQFKDISPAPSPSATTTGAQSAASSPPSRGPPRLASLKSRKPPISSLGPSASEPPKPQLKFLPKSAVRRSKEVRDAAEKAEAERRQSRLAAEGMSSAAVGGRGGLQGRDGRGGSRVGRVDRDRFAGSQASGHLGGSTIGEDGGRQHKITRGGRLGGASEPSRSAARGKQGLIPKLERDGAGNFITSGGSSQKRAFIKEETLGPAFASSDDEPDIAEGPRVNIEYINLISDDETVEEDSKQTSQHHGRMMGDTKSPSFSLKPVRIDRHDHVERAITGNTDLGSLTSAELRQQAQERGEAEASLFISDDPQTEGMGRTAKGKSKVKDVEFVRDERRWKGVYQDEEGDTEPRIKKEPDDDDSRMVVDHVEPHTSAGEHVSPALEERAAIHDVAATTRHSSDTETNKPEASRPDPSRRHKLKKTVFQTEEDRQEWNRYEEELEFLREELGTTALGLVGATATPSTAGEEVNPITDESINLSEGKEGRVYLFQLPPIAPQLLTMAEHENRLKAQAEQEKEAAHPSHPSNSSVSIHSRPGLEDLLSDKRTTDSPDIATTTHPPRTPGKIGTLRVYGSGRVKLEWGNAGGAGMELRRGFRSSMLQEVIMTNFDRTSVKAEAGDEGSTKIEGEGPEKEKGKDQEKMVEKINVGDTALALGELAGSFVLTPDWDKMFKR